MVQKIRTAKTSGKQLCIHLSRVESGFGTVNSVHNGRVDHISALSTIEGLHCVINEMKGFGPKKV